MARDTSAIIRKRLQSLTRVVDGSLPDGALFTVLVWIDDDVEGRIGHYVSNAQPADVAQAMREIAGRLEGRTAPESEN